MTFKWNELLVLLTLTAIILADLVLLHPPTAGKAVEGTRESLPAPQPPDFSSTDPAFHYSASSDTSDAEDAVRGLILRMLGVSYVDSFTLMSNLTTVQPDSRDVFVISGGGSSGDSVLLQGNSGVALASALGWYLKYYCHVEISWNEHPERKHAFCYLPNA